MRRIAWRAAALALGPLMAPPISHAHVVLAEPVALAQTTYRATLRVAHGCAGAATTSLQVLVPEGFAGAHPMPKPGWRLSVRRAPLERPYDNHGSAVAEDVREVTWTAASADAALPDAHFDEFVLLGRLGAQAGPMWFKAVQGCTQGRNAWVEVPAGGTSTRGLAMPAALLEVIPSEPAAGGHAH